METHPVVSIRLDPKLAERLEGQITRLGREQPGVRWNRSNVIRTALIRYLRDQEARELAEQQAEQAAG